MPAKNPRVNVVLERPLYEALSRLARREGTSLSLKARDLLREALEAYEDLALDRIAQDRERTFDRSRSLSHREVWQFSEKLKRR
ncbi:MAG: antitoxin, RHH family protein [Candidatus Rokubacteria bacterium]|nr:antitoxin, RHH family protein [Candidatus Rokubacteria bacterium]